MRRPTRPRRRTWAWAVALLVAGNAAPVTGQACRLPESIRASIPLEPPARGSYAPFGTGTFAELDLGVGHLHYSASNPVPDLPPGEDRWLLRLELPLSPSPDAAPSAWMAGGWILTPGQRTVPLNTTALIETGYEEPSFVVLEARDDGWLRVRYGAGDRDDIAAWTPTCAWAASPAVLDFSPWSEWLLSGEIGPLFFRTPLPEALRSDPSPGSASVAEIVAGDYALMPLEIRDDWMRVELRRPSDYCAFDATPTRTEGWIRWRAPDVGPRVWYYTRGC